MFILERNEGDWMHKITLTGYAINKVRVVDDVLCAFEMEEKGSDNPPKGLPKSTRISYTVFANKKQLKKMGIELNKKPHQKLLIQGEPTLDVPLDICQGEIGVVCFQIQVLPEKTDAQGNQNDQEKKEKIKSAPMQYPKGTQKIIDIDAVVIPNDFQQRLPRAEKIQSIVSYFEKENGFDRPITINEKSSVLEDGYARYLAAKEMGIHKIPIAYIK